MASERNQNGLTVVSENTELGTFKPDELEIVRMRESDGQRFKRVLLLSVNEVSGDQLLQLIGRANPTIVVDLRYSPKFHRSRLSRKEFLSALKSINAFYLDSFGMLQFESPASASDDQVEMVGRVSGWIEAHPKTIPGGIVFLTDKRGYSRHLVDAIELMEHPTGDSWAVETYPDFPKRRHLAAPHTVVSNTDATDKQFGERKFVFISHANPDDNDFSLWLSAKLQAAGFQTWVDLESLKGGAVFWEEIEETLRNKTAKVIFVQSAKSLERPNVLNEIDLALSVERRQSIRDFIIPVRIDHSEFDNTYVGLRRRLIVDCADNWSTGLSQIIDVLEGSDIPRVESVKHDIILRVFGQRTGDTLIEKESDSLVSNWYDVIGWPEKCRVSATDSTSPESDSDSRFIQARFKGMVFDFESRDGELSSSSSKPKVVLTDDLFEGRCNESLEMTTRQARIVLSRLTRLAWDNKMHSAGMRPYKLSGYRTSWFWPANSTVEKKTKFVDSFGVAHSRSLSGRSEKYDVHWHFAVECVPDFESRAQLVLKPHVVFTRDGESPIDSPSLMHRLRRSFCKNWWNSRWRDLIGAYVQQIRDGEEIELPAGCGKIVVCRFPTVFVSPVTPVKDSAVIEAGADADLDIDPDEDTEIDTMLGEEG